MLNSVQEGDTVLEECILVDLENESLVSRWCYMKDELVLAKPLIFFY